jgi:hypothetical protein
VLALAALAVFVQIVVWGATKIRTDGALLESWQPYFSWPYGIAFAGAQLGVCRWLRVARGPTWLVRTWLLTGVTLAAAAWLAGRHVRVEELVPLVAGLGAVVLAAGLYEGRLRLER